MAALQTKLPGVLLLTDPKFQAGDAWGVHLTGADGPSPATYIVGGDGVIRWRKLPDSHGDWPTYDELAKATASR
jgi:hypothetical protein